MSDRCVSIEVGQGKSDVPGGLLPEACIAVESEVNSRPEAQDALVIEHLTSEFDIATSEEMSKKRVSFLIKGFFLLFGGLAFALVYLFFALFFFVTFFGRRYSRDLATRSFVVISLQFETKFTAEDNSLTTCSPSGCMSNLFYLPFGFFLYLFHLLAASIFAATVALRPIADIHWKLSMIAIEPLRCITKLPEPVEQALLYSQTDNCYCNTRPPVARDVGYQGFGTSS